MTAGGRVRGAGREDHGSVLWGEGVGGVYAEGVRRFVLLGVPREFFFLLLFSFFFSPMFSSPTS